MGAVDGFMPSSLPAFNNDALSRRDFGLEFLDVTDDLDVERVYSKSRRRGRRQDVVYKITNTSSSVVDTHLLIVVEGLPRHTRLKNASGTTSDGDPFIRVFLDDGVLLPDQSIVQKLRFKRRFGARRQPVRFSLTFLSGQGTP